MGFWNKKELEAIETLENVPRETLISYLTRYCDKEGFPLAPVAVLKIYLAYCDLENFYSNVEIRVKTWKGLVRAVLMIDNGNFFSSQMLEISAGNGTNTKEKREKFGRGQIKEYLFNGAPDGDGDRILYEKVFGEIVDKIPLQEYQLF